MLPLNSETLALLRELAAKYVWWKPVEEALAFPERIVAQVMDIGEFEDAQRMSELLGKGVLRAVLTKAAAGQLTARSWAYWHYRLGMSEPGEAPPLPARRTA